MAQLTKSFLNIHIIVDEPKLMLKRINVEKLQAWRPAVNNETFQNLGKTYFYVLDTTNKKS